jgi:hypothetical protein
MTLDDQPRSGRASGRVAAAQLRLLDLAVTKRGGVVRYLHEADHGLRSSIFRNG